MFTKNISVMILAAGYGKRLKPLTDRIPKPLIKVAGITLLQNVLEHILKLNCKEIIINTHYKHKMISNFIKNNYPNNNIFISYEKKILDTGGGVKNALSLFTNKNILIINSDIFWQSKNFQEIKKLVSGFTERQKCKLLLVSKKYAHGIYHSKGDFVIHNGLIKRYKEKQRIYYYSGAQIISSDIFNEYKKEKFSFNVIWDQLITKKLVYGNLMKSDWYHIGNINGLKETEDLII